LAAGDKAQALEAFRRAVTINPSNHEALNNVGILLLDDADRLSDAEAAFRRALEAKPDSAPSHSHLGLALKAQGRLDEALSAMHRALELDPNYAPAHNGLAIVLNEQGESEEAVTALRRAIEITPNYVAAHKNLGLILRDQGQHAESSAAFERTLALDANDPDGYKNLGLGLRKLGRLDEAIEVFERGLSHAPDDAELHVNLGLLHQRSRDTDKAFRYFRRATELAPENRFYWQCFADSFRAAQFKRFDDRVRRDLEQCLAIDGLSHRSYSDSVARFLRLAPETEARIEAAKRGSLKLSAEEVATGRVFRAIGGSLLVRLMERAEIPDPDLEIMLTAIRRDLLWLALENSPVDDIGDQALAFVCALAQQCFLNEYIYLPSDDEPAAVGRLRADLERRLVYDEPVQRIDADAPFGRLVKQQIVEPRVEFEIMESLPSLAPVSDAVSRQVRAQYEENPYPRWIGLAEQTTIPTAAVFGEIFPHLAPSERTFPDTPEFLPMVCARRARWGWRASRGCRAIFSPRRTWSDASMSSSAQASCITCAIRSKVGACCSGS
jgi:tetratricopeptide (TPR) repeat protein